MLLEIVGTCCYHQVSNEILKFIKDERKHALCGTVLMVAVAQRCQLVRISRNLYGNQTQLRKYGKPSKNTDFHFHG